MPTWQQYICQYQDTYFRKYLLQVEFLSSYSEQPLTFLSGLVPLLVSTVYTIHLIFCFANGTWKVSAQIMFVLF